MCYGELSDYVGNVKINMVFIIGLYISFNQISLPLLFVSVFLCGSPFCNDHQSFGVSKRKIQVKILPSWIGVETVKWSFPVIVLVLCFDQSWNFC